MRRRNNSEKEALLPDITKKFSNLPIQASDMACRDRTSEFFSVIKNKKRDVNIVAQARRGKQKHTERWSHFMSIAKQIGKDITSTFTKLEKLTLLAKKRSIFDDKPVEIEELTYIIKQDINSLNKQIADLQSISKTNTSGKHMNSHSNIVVVSLQSKLASMSNDFRQVLEVRTENLKFQKSRKENFVQGAVSSTLPASAVSHHTGSVLLNDDNAVMNTGNGDVAINMENMASRQLQQQQTLINEEELYLESRTDAMQNIESTIVELGSIFQQLALMVKEQEEQVLRIDSNVEDAQLSIEAAHGEILKYFQSVTSNRWLMIKVFAVLIIFFIIFVVFIA